MATKTATRKPTNNQSDLDAIGDKWTDDEIAAMKEHARELKTAQKRADSKAADKEAEGEADVVKKIAEMPQADQKIAQRIHEIVKSSAPGLAARTYYGMPAYAKDGKVVAFYKPAFKFKGRYGTLGFEDMAALDDGEMWPTSYAVTKLTPATEKRIAEILKRAAG
jgi:uncharacterized protein YdhG (YjbR/CyaY superfamily)